MSTVGGGGKGRARGRGEASDHGRADLELGGALNRGGEVRVCYPFAVRDDGLGGRVPDKAGRLRQQEPRREPEAHGQPAAEEMGIRRRSGGGAEKGGGRGRSGCEGGG